MKARVSDIGVYRCAARNRFGVSLTSAKLSVGDSPDKPTRPIVSQFTRDQVCNKTVGLTELFLNKRNESLLQNRCPWASFVECK
jgi:hypothetical protein